jgi:hypothetical protein
VLGYHEPLEGNTFKEVTSKRFKEVSLGLAAVSTLPATVLGGVAAAEAGRHHPLRTANTVAFVGTGIANFLAVTVPNSPYPPLWNLECAKPEDLPPNYPQGTIANSLSSVD